MSRLCPAADRAWRVGRSVGRRSSPRAATPADTAPEETTRTRWPSPRSSTTSLHSFTTAAKSMTPRLSVSELEPILATTVGTRSPFRLVLEAVGTDVDNVAFGGAGARQRLAHAEAAQPGVRVGQRVGVREVGQGDGPLGRPPVHPELTLAEAFDGDALGDGPVDHEAVGLGLGPAGLAHHRRHGADQLPQPLAGDGRDAPPLPR